MKLALVQCTFIKKNNYKIKKIIKNTCCIKEQRKIAQDIN